MLHPPKSGDSDEHIAEVLATSAGELLRGVQKNPLLYGEQLGLVGDRVSHTYIRSTLECVRPGDYILSEEDSADDAALRMQASRVWIVDPLDGTREFKNGTDHWGVHVALWEQGKPLVGAVAIPTSSRLAGTYTTGGMASLSHATGVAVVSRSRSNSISLSIAEELGLTVVHVGSAAVKAMAVVAGLADAYIHVGGQYEWDSCAPVAVARSVGLHCSHMDGTALEYNNSNTFMPNILICRPELAQPIIELYKRSLCDD